MKKTKAPYNRRGFHTKNYTQDMRKDQFSSNKEDTDRSVTLTTEDTPSGEQSLPDIR